MSVCIIKSLSEPFAQKSLPYNNLYMSIGSKYNEDRVHFNRPICTHCPTNAKLQMIPEFLRNRDPSIRILVIIIDDFHDETVLSYHSRLLSRHLDENIDVIIVNQKVDKLALEQSIQTVCRMATTLNIEPSHFMICNYVKFCNEPNREEAANEEMIPNVIYQILKHQWPFYSSCFYEWFGYRFYTYNLIYRYEKFRLFMNYPAMLTLFDQTLKNRMFDVMIDYELIGKDRYWSEIVDISMPIMDTKDTATKMTMSLLEYITKPSL